MAKFSRVVFAAAIAVGMLLVSYGEVLVSEGCDTSNDYKGLGSGGAALLGSYPKNFQTSVAVGLGGSTWGGYGSQPRVWPKNLPLPACFGTALVSQGEACVGMNNGTNAADNRWGYLGLAKDKLKIGTGTKIYFRGLINVDNGAAGALTKPGSDAIGNKNCFGFCLTTRPSTYGGSGGTPIGLPNHLGFYYWKTSGGSYAVSVRVTNTSKRLLDNLAAPTASGVSEENTFICYAEVNVGAGTDGKEIVRAGAARVSDYDLGNVTWCEPFETEIISDSAFPTHLAIVGDYCVNGWALMDEFVVGTELSDIIVAALPGSPKLTEAYLSGDSGSYTAGANLSDASATDAGVVAVDGDNVGVKFSAGAVAFDAVPVPFQSSFGNDGLQSDKTYEVFVYAENDVAAMSNSVGTVYSGVLSLLKVKNADEYQCKPGEVTVSRASADPYPLAVNYTFTSATEGAAAGKTWIAPQPIVIQAGETSASILLTPIVDATIAEDIVVTLSIQPGNYSAVAQTVDLTLKNLVAPEGYNTWVASVPGKASDAANWSLGHAPMAADNILFDGNFSNVGCSWDADATSTVASWTQRDGFTGMVTVETKYPEAANATFTKLTVFGDMVIDYGMLTQVSNDVQKEEYRLNVGIGGDLTIGSAGSIDVTGRGPRGVMSGRSANVYAGDQNTYQKTYGDPKRPYYCGSGNNGAWPTSYKGAGGGAAWIEVAGTATVNGKILSEGSILNSNMDTFDGKNGNISTSGGSVYLKAGALAGDGNGLISAKSEFSCNQDNQIGSGGRIAVELTTSAYDFDSGAVQFKANANAKQAGSPGHGTIVIKNPGEANGTLYVLGKHDRTFSYNNCEYTYQQTTAIPKGDTWTFDRVVVGDFGMITVGEGSTLSLPNGWASVYASNKSTDALKKYACGIILRGGTLNVPAVGGKHEFKNGAWTFHPTGGYVLNADTEISGGASVGAMYLSAGTNTAMACDVKVVGNLDVKSDGFMNAVFGGIGGTATFAGEAYTPFHKATVAFGTGHGGQNAYIGTQNLTYGSFFNPVLPGTPSGHADVRYVGSGVIILEVTGTLNVDGKIQTCSGWDGQYWADRPSAPGSVNITAAQLTGSGSIRADGAAGYVGAYPKSGWEAQGPSGGGRVAIRLTGTGATIPDSMVAKITAKGVSPSGALKSDTADENIRYSSAGSVYLQTAAEGEKKGTIIIRNDGVAANTAWTSLPAAAETDAAADFKNASLSLLDCGKVRLYDTVQMSKLTLAADCKIDLNGKTLTVSSAKLGENVLAAGTYAAGATALGDFVTDSATGGSLIVTVAAKRGLTILFR